MTMSRTCAVQSVHAWEVIDSRGRPTVATEVSLDGGVRAAAMVPSGASTGAHEALELRDADRSRFGGEGVLRAAAHAAGPLAAAIAGVDATDQAAIDQALRDADGTPNLGAMGANAVLGVSLAVAHAAAAAKGVSLYEHLGACFGSARRRLPVPMLNVLNGGAHADNGLDVQEIMLAPHGFERFADALRAGVETYHALRALLLSRGLSVAVGDEGGFAPRVSGNEAAVELVALAIEQAGYTPGTQVSLALDVAASEFHQTDGYHWEGAPRSADALCEVYASWLDRYPIYSIEDGLDEDDWHGWRALTTRFGERTQLVGDDFFVTNAARVSRGIEEGAANAVLIKPNQVGTLSDTFACLHATYEAGWSAVMSHRSGETEDTTIADLAVATATGQIKTGAPCRSERTAKYNRLLRIEADAHAAGSPLPFGFRDGARP